MKLVVFGPFKRLGGLLKDGGIVDLNLAYAEYLKDKGQIRAQAHADATLPPNLQAFLEEGDTALKAARNALTYAQKTKELVMRPEGIKIWAPLASWDNKIVAAGFNFAEGVASRIARTEKREVTPADFEMAYQLVKEGKHLISGFWKLPQTVIGPDEPMIYPSRTKHLHYEVELAAVIGKRGKNIKADEGDDYIFGYSVFNDWMIRDDPPAGHPDWVMFKNFDTSTSLGPCIVTKDEIPDVFNLKLESRLNGELAQSFSSKTMLRNFPLWIEHISRDLTLLPGDIFASGSGGSLFPNEPMVGDVVEISIEGIGSMKNPVVTAQ